jgi:hypothetical protein
VIVVFAYIITPLSASAQIVEPDVKRWSEEQCIWLHREALDECKRTDPQQECSGKLADQGSMSTIRRLNALDAFWTVRDREEFEGICFKVCKDNAKPTYRQFRKEFCSKDQKAARLTLRQDCPARSLTTASQTSFGSQA